MRFSWEHLAALGASVFVVVLAWFSGNWFHVIGMDRAILSGGILIIGAALIGGLLMWRKQSKQALGSIGGKTPPIEAGPAGEEPWSASELERDKAPADSWFNR